VENDVLKDFYKSADLYLSLSTYHDEDFGMSVAEALMSGLPAILSNWAGYSSFNFSNEFVKFINVKLGNQEPTIELAFAKENLIEMLNKDFDRSKLALLAKEYLDIKACGKTIKRILNEVVDPFEGVSDLMIRLTSEQGVRGLEFFRSETNREFNSFYFKVYDVYTE
jgi:glycosyltransferase involved in cell wall biosynthesis